VQEVADGIPGASFVVVPDAAHLPNAEQPGAVNEALAGLLSSGGAGWP
jgi:3-oxoadipate enol-lactonase